MYNPLLVPELRDVLDKNDREGLREFCEVLHPATVAETLEGLSSPVDAWTVLSTAGIQRQVEIFEFMSLAKQVELVESVDRQHLSRLIEEMSPDDRADLLSRLPGDRVEEMLPLIAQAERSDIRKLLSYPEESAGAIMTTEYASLPEQITVREAIERLRKQAPQRETIYYVYIIDEGRHLQGAISLQELILAKPDSILADSMKKDVIRVRVDDDQEFVAQELARYNFIAIPVVDKQNCLVGIITHDDVLDVVQEEANEDAYRQGAIAPIVDSYLETPFLEITWKRGVWLVFLATMALVTAAVLKQNDRVTAKYDWMILFLPLVLASGGNSGSQSATLVIRSIAVGELTRSKNLQMARRELWISVALGSSLAAIGLLAALIWFGLPLGVSLVVALTVFLVVVMGTVTGALLPLVFKSFGMDPALMSNPLIAALVDVLGVVIYCGAIEILVGDTG